MVRFFITYTRLNWMLSCCYSTMSVTDKLCRHLLVMHVNNDKKHINGPAGLCDSSNKRICILNCMKVATLAHENGYTGTWKWPHRHMKVATLAHENGYTGTWKWLHRHMKVATQVKQVGFFVSSWELPYEALLKHRFGRKREALRPQRASNQHKKIDINRGNLTMLSIFNRNHWLPRKTRNTAIVSLFFPL